MKLEVKVAQALTNQGKSISTAESCTGGLVANLLTNVPGSSSFFLGGLITYTNEAKSKLLGISPELLAKKGAVCQDVATQMAKKVRQKFKADFGIGLSGIAGPDGGTAKKPVGLVFICVATKYDSLCLKCIFPGTRLQIKSQAAKQALKLLLEFVVEP